MSTYAKYMDRFKRMRSASSDTRDAAAFKSSSIVDRETYTKFMELELEKVSSAFMKIKDLPERVEQLQNQIILNQEKISNLSKIINLVQETENSQENDIRDIKAALRKLGVNSIAAKDREYTKFKILHPQNEETNDLIHRIRNLESRLDVSKNEPFSEPQNFEYGNFVTKVDRSLQEMEEKLIHMISERLSEHLHNTSKASSDNGSRGRSKSPSLNPTKKRKRSNGSTSDRVNQDVSHSLC